MTQYISLNVKLLNSELNKLNSAVINRTKIVLGLSSDMIGISNGEPSFPHES